MQGIVLEFIETLRNKKYANNSISYHKQDLKKFFKWFNIEEENADNKILFDLLRKLQQSDIEEYIIFLGKTYKPRTLARHISSLKLVMS